MFAVSMVMVPLPSWICLFTCSGGRIVHAFVCSFTSLAFLRLLTILLYYAVHLFTINA